MSELLAGFPVTVEIPVAWGEMDSFGHVNNIIYFRYFETARMEYFTRLGFADFKKLNGVGPILSKTSCRFRRSLTFPDQALVGTRVVQLGEDRFVNEYHIVSRKENKLVAEGESLIVAFDYRKNQKTPLPAVIRDGIRKLEGRDLPGIA